MASEHHRVTQHQETKPELYSFLDRWARFCECLRREWMNPACNDSRESNKTKNAANHDLVTSQKAKQKAA